MRKQNRLAGAVLAALLPAAAGVIGAQSAPEAARNADTASVPARSIEDLNMRGSDVSMPPFTDSQIDVNSPFRQALAEKGVALRLISQSRYAQNMLRAPSPADRQVYVGDHPYEGVMAHLILTADLRQFGLQHAQLHLSGDWNWASWEPAGPKTFTLWSLYLYKEFLNDHVEVKAGYNGNSLEFVGLQVGGSTANGVQGVYAVLPNEVGMSFFPLTSPQFNLLLRGPSRFYLKTGLQRSMDAGGGPATEARNHSGFRFAPKGDKLLIIEELGWRRSASVTARQTWFRMGYLRNATPYTNLSNSRMELGNHGAYALLDYQLSKSDPDQPARGLYAGGSVMTAASQFNAYNRYYEARIYQMGPFRKRAGDTASLVGTYTGHSSFLTDSLVAQGKTVWRNGASVTGGYNIRVAPGNYLSLGLSYMHGPAITPRVGDALTFSAMYSVYF